MVRARGERHCTRTCREGPRSAPRAARAWLSDPSLGRSLTGISLCFEAKRVSWERSGCVRPTGDSSQSSRRTRLERCSEGLSRSGTDGGCRRACPSQSEGFGFGCRTQRRGACWLRVSIVKRERLSCYCSARHTPQEAVRRGHCHWPALNRDVNTLDALSISINCLRGRPPSQHNT